jgi:hypothetical protein
MTLQQKYRNWKLILIRYIILDRNFQQLNSILTYIDFQLELQTPAITLVTIEPTKKRKLLSRQINKRLIAPCSPVSIARVERPSRNMYGHIRTHFGIQSTVEPHYLVPP